MALVLPLVAGSDPGIPGLPELAGRRAVCWTAAPAGAHDGAALALWIVDAETGKTIAAVAFDPTWSQLRPHYRPPYRPAVASATPAASWRTRSARCPRGCPASWPRSARRDLAHDPHQQFELALLLEIGNHLQGTYRERRAGPERCSAGMFARNSTSSSCAGKSRNRRVSKAVARCTDDRTESLNCWIFIGSRSSNTCLTVSMIRWMSAVPAAPRR
ncbi:MAG TPA: hypothetical protein VF516_24890, partial [Kofleriaceae bacterium]